MIRILFFIPTLIGGGAEKVLINLVNNMNFSKFDITVLTLFDVGVNKKFLKDHIQYKSVFKHLFRGNVAFFRMFSTNFLYKFMIKDEYDVIISYLQSPTIRIVSGCDNPSVVKINWIHNDFKKIEQLSSIFRSIKELKKCFSSYDATVFVAESAKKSLIKILPEIEEKSHVIYNVNEIDMIRQKSTEKIDDVLFNQNRISLISSGRYAKVKGFDKLIRITEKLIKEDHINVHLYLLGKGKLEGQYVHLINTLDLKDHVTLLGYKENPYAYVKNADLFVCSSLNEGYSTVVTESLIVGTPVITTRCSGMEELLGSNGEFGIITENNEDSLYQGLKLLLSDQSELLRLKEQAAKRGSMFDQKKAVREVEELLVSLVEKKAAYHE